MCLLVLASKRIAVLLYWFGRAAVRALFSLRPALQPSLRLNVLVHQPEHERHLREYVGLFKLSMDPGCFWPAVLHLQLLHVLSGVTVLLVMPICVSVRRIVWKLGLHRLVREPALRRFWRL